MKPKQPSETARVGPRAGRSSSVESPRHRGRHPRRDLRATGTRERRRQSPRELAREPRSTYNRVRLSRHPLPFRALTLNSSSNVLRKPPHSQRLPPKFFSLDRLSNPAWPTAIVLRRLRHDLPASPRARCGRNARLARRWLARPPTIRPAASPGSTIVTRAPLRITSYVRGRPPFASRVAARQSFKSRVIGDKLRTANAAPLVSAFSAPPVALAANFAGHPPRGAGQAK